MQWCRFLSVLCLVSVVNSAVLAATPTSVSKNTTTTTSAAKKSAYNKHDMWHIIAANFSLNHYANTPEVQKQIKWFLANPSYFQKIATQGQPYMYYIYQEVKQRGLPGELVLLPMIESAYDPFAYSWVGAAGLWQMMPATGANFGLKEDWWYDGRKDIIASTSAALDYLTYLETFFNGNWPLAIAAYNSGEGTVQNAIDRNAHRGLATNFWSLHLPLETESYVPRLLALAAIISDPAKYGVTLPPVHDGQYFDSVTLQKQIDLSQAAKMAGITLATLYQLNPGFNRWATDPKGPYRLLLPVSAIYRFKEMYGDMYGIHNIKGGAPKSDLTTHAVLINKNENSNLNKMEEKAVTLKNSTKTNTVTTKTTTVTNKTNAVPTQTTNTVSSAAHSNGLATSTNGSKASTTQPNTTSTVNNAANTPPSKVATTATPSTATATTTPSVTATPAPMKPAAPTTITYTVKKGDTLWSIAKHYNVTVGKIRTWNRLSERAKLHAGQKIIIHLPTKAQ